MDRKNRVRFAVWGIVVTSLFLFGVGVWFLTKPSVVMQAVLKYNPNPNYVPHMFFEDIPAYVLIGTGVLLLAFIPAAIKSAHKKADMDEMLEDYRQRKNRP